MGQATCTFDGIAATRGWDFNFGPGVTPSSLVLQVPPSLDAGINFGTLVIRQDAKILTFPDCLVTNATLGGGKGGRLWTLTIKDRRWRWQYSIIDGYYNRQKEDSTYDFERTPRELASLLLDAMGETGYDVTRLPNDARPFSNWQGVSAAPLLMRLCTDLGCVPLLNPATNRAEIWPIGQGFSLPQGNQITASFPIAYGSIPDQIRVVTSQSWFQAPLKLGEPVGIDTDGSIKPIDDLTYTPSDGWDHSDPFEHYNVSGTYENQGVQLKKQDLAKACVWKMYRVTELEKNGFSLHAIQDQPVRPTKIDDFLPLRLTKLTKHPDADGVEREDEMSISGTYLSGTAAFENVKGTVPRSRYRLDVLRGIVVFSEPIFKWDDRPQGIFTIAAELVLETSFAITGNGVQVRAEFFRDRDPGNLRNTGPKIYLRPDLRTKVVEDKVEVLGDNVQEVEDQANLYLDSVAASFDPVEGSDVTYEGIELITPDGLTRQVTWSGGGGRPAKTRASQVENWNPYMPTAQKQAEIIENERASEATKAEKFADYYNPDVF